MSLSRLVILFSACLSLAVSCRHKPEVSEELVEGLNRTARERFKKEFSLILRERASELQVIEAEVIDRDISDYRERATPYIAKIKIRARLSNGEDTSGMVKYIYNGLNKKWEYISHEYYKELEH
ncbi:MAG: hypothetical protein ACLFQK_01735 [Fibrobacterota bacterium]